MVRMLGAGGWCGVVWCGAEQRGVLLRGGDGPYIS